MKLVIDTNVMRSIVLYGKRDYWLFERLIDGSYSLCISTEILEEYEEILSRRYNQEFMETILEVILNLPSVEQVALYYHFDLIKVDRDDNKFVDCAIACGADYIITDDKHFRVLKEIEFPKVNVLTLDEFREKFL
jgi:putative PIN family toxin of toxin-antitoxin system